MKKAEEVAQKKRVSAAERAAAAAAKPAKTGAAAANDDADIDPAVNRALLVLFIVTTLNLALCENNAL